VLADMVYAPSINARDGPGSCGVMVPISGRSQSDYFPGQTGRLGSEHVSGSRPAVCVLAPALSLRLQPLVLLSSVVALDRLSVPGLALQRP